MKRVPGIAAAIVLVLASVAATALGATAERDPFQRLATRPDAGTDGALVELRLAGRVRVGERALALLVAADGVGRIVEEGSLLPELGLRVVRIGTQTVRLRQIGGGGDLLVAAAPGSLEALPAEEDR
jgi:hypothetical protein